jgi:hypothetical protein
MAALNGTHTGTLRPWVWCGAAVCLSPWFPLMAQTRYGLARVCVCMHAYMQVVNRQCELINAHACMRWHKHPQPFGSDSVQTLWHMHGGAHKELLPVQVCGTQYNHFAKRCTCAHPKLGAYFPGQSALADAQFAHANVQLAQGSTHPCPAPPPPHPTLTPTPTPSPRHTACL